ncbi:MAG: Holliday junction branch migration protein RuvA [Desulfosalsimonadaceae bacterium]
MIAYLEGRLLKKESDRIWLLVNHVGYEIMVPAFVMNSLENSSVDDELSLYIYFHQTERTPRPVLIGFNREAEREFFEIFISVETIGPLKAVKAMTLPVEEIAMAIESGDAVVLKQLSGIGERMANKIIATLQGKTGKFGIFRKNAGPCEDVADIAVEKEAAAQVIDVLVSRLGYKPFEAREMVSAAMTRNPSIDDPESLFEEVYRGGRLTGEGQQ